MIKELSFFHFNVNGKENYGGNQEWYDTRFARMAGCSAVLATNLFYYYKDELDVSYDKFRETMDYWFMRNKPGLIGFPYFVRFTHNFLEEAEKNDMHLTADMKKNIASVDDGWRFVTKHIDAGEPVGMLILTHNAKEINDETWHWMCITGYDTTKKEVIISSVGERITMQADMLFKPCFRNVVKLLSFVNPAEDYTSRVHTDASADE